MSIKQRILSALKKLRRTSARETPTVISESQRLKQEQLRKEWLERPPEPVVIMNELWFWNNH